MRMLATYHNYGLQNHSKGRVYGFSLLELLVVLSLLSLITALALPNLSRMYNSFSNALEVEEVVRQINGIGYQVQNKRQEFLFQSMESGKAVVAQSGVNVRLPEGWSVVLEKPLRYAENGACFGGFVRIFYEDELRQAVRLEAPFCQVKL
jgi:prepilin-type N-terminal cleavage/methylation domain-containing protein